MPKNYFAKPASFTLRHTSIPYQMSYKVRQNAIAAALQQEINTHYVYDRELLGIYEAVKYLRQAVKH